MIVANGDVSMTIIIQQIDVAKDYSFPYSAHPTSPLQENYQYGTTKPPNHKERRGSKPYQKTLANFESKQPLLQPRSTFTLCISYLALLS